MASNICQALFRGPASAAKSGVTWHTTDLIHRPPHPADLPRPPPRNRTAADAPAPHAITIPTAAAAAAEGQVQEADAEEKGAAALQAVDYGTDGAPPAKKAKVEHAS